MDKLGGSHGKVGVYKAVVPPYKGTPLGILGHGDRTGAKLVNGAVRSVCLSLENAGICVVRLLDLANNDSLKLPSRILEVQVGLVDVSIANRDRQVPANLPDAGSSLRPPVSPAVGQPPPSEDKDPVCLSSKPSQALFDPRSPEEC